LPTARDVDHRGDVLARHLGLARHAAKREYRTRGNDLEQIRAIVDQELRTLTESLSGRARRRRESARCRRFLEIGDVEVATAVRNREVMDRWPHARPERFSRVDLIAECRVAPST
jgi:hypothetical protein